MSQCGKCAKVVNAQESITCVECKGVFHTSCVQVRSAKIQTVRNVWKCENCVCESSSNSSRVSEKEGSSASSMSAILQGIESMRKDMAQQFNEVKSQLSTVNESITSMKIQLDTLTKENKDRKEEYLELKQENKELKEELTAIKSQIQDIDQYGRRDNIEIVGVPHSQGENVYQVLESIAKIIGVPFTRQDVSIAHRLPENRKTGKANIVVKFVNRYCKMDWTNQARVCKRLTASELCSSWSPSKIFVNDHLTYNNKRLLGYMRELVRDKRIVGAWTTDCKLKMRVHAEGKVYHIKTMEDIKKAMSIEKIP